MNLHIRVVVLGVGLGFGLITCELLRRRYLRPEYALVWMAMSLWICLLAIFPRLINVLTFLTGMEYQSSVILLVFVLIGLMFVNFSLITCRHGRRIVRLTQEIALLRMEVREAKDRSGQALG